MSQKNMVNSMTEGNVYRQLLWFSLPLIGANALQTLYSLVDAVVVGNCLGAAELAAVSNSGELITFYTMLCMGFASAGQVIVGQYVGKGDHGRLARSVGSMAAVLGVFALLCSVLNLCTPDWQLSLLRIPEESMPHARSYFLTCSVGLIFVFGYNGVSAILRGMGDSKRPLIFVAIASVTNLVLDLLFVMVFGMGVFGAALATILGQAFSFLASIIYLYKKRAMFGAEMSRRALAPCREEIWLLIRLGVPHAIQYGAIIISMLFVSARINDFGVAAAAANGVAAKLDNILRMVCNSLGTAGCVLVAQNMGANRQDRVKTIIYGILKISVTYSLLCAAVIFFFPKTVFSLFNRDSEVLALAAVYAGAGVVNYIGAGLRGAFCSVYNGVGNARLAMVSGLLDGVVARIGLALLLGETLGLGLRGYWYGGAAAGYVAAAIGALYFYSGKWKSYRLTK